MKEKKISCILCGRKSYVVLYKSNMQEYSDKNYLITDSDYGKHPQIVKCTCGLIYVNPRETDSSLTSHYENLNDPQYQQEAANRALSFKTILRRLESIHPKKGRILDIGCATGIFMNEAQNRQWKAYGCDLSRWAVSYARKVYKLKNASVGDVSTLPYKHNFFDAIVILDVIEHVPDPGSLLKRSYNLLKDDGVLCIVTPNIGSITARIMKESWWHIRPPHIFYFDITSLKSALKKHGFSVTHRYNYMWHFKAAYIYERLSKVKNPLFKAIHFLLLKTIMRHTSKFTIPINLGDSVEIYCKKIYGL